VNSSEWYLSDKLDHLELFHYCSVATAWGDYASLLYTLVASSGFLEGTGENFFSVHDTSVLLLLWTWGLWQSWLWGAKRAGAVRLTSSSVFRAVRLQLNSFNFL